MKKIYWILALSILLLAGCSENMKNDAKKAPSVTIINEEKHLTNEEIILNESVADEEEEYLKEEDEIEQNLSDIEELEKEVNETLNELDEIEKNLQELDDLTKELEELSELDQDLEELEELLEE
jgi:PBP1b-binding outer membrane lipoprotein LpoB